MKHLMPLSKERPNAAFIDGHPDIGYSLSEFLKDPIGVINFHVK